jgi:hypothetical protein
MAYCAAGLIYLARLATARAATQNAEFCAARDG